MVLKPRASSTTSSRSWSIPSGFRDRRLQTAAGYDDFSQFFLLDNRSAKVIKRSPAFRASGRHMARTTQLIAAALLAVALIGAYVAGQNETNQTEYNTSVFYEPEIVDAFESNSEVRVSVVIIDDSNITVTGSKEERQI